MDRIVDEIVLFGLGLPLLLLAPAAPAAVAAPLLALIATGALELLDRGEGGAQRQAPASAASPVRAARFIRVARPAIAAAYLIAALAAPALAAFVPLLAYAAVAQNLGPLRFLWPATLLGAAVSGSGALAAAALLLGALACLAARRTTKVQTERASLRQWRDAVQEDRLALAERTRDLAERQDLEVSCAVLAERARIAREIHDNVGHLLTRSVLQMEALAVTHEDDPALAKELAAVGVTLHEALGTVRASVHDLHDEAFDPQTTLAELIGEFPGIAGTLAFEAESLPRPVALAVVAIVREALANACTHGRATSVAVSLLEFPGFYQLAIEDNGRAANLVGEGGLGLASMEERATALGGTFSFGPVAPTAHRLPRLRHLPQNPGGSPMSAPSPLSVVIVDDDELVAQSLRTILEARGNVRVAALGTKGAEAAALFNEHHPDIMLLDIRMPDLSGLAAGEAILAAHPKARIVFLTTFADDDYIVRALAIGARGYLIKQEARGLAEALHSVMEGQIVLGSDVTDRVSALIGQRPANGAGAAFDDSLSHPDNSQAAPAFAEGLTQRERDIAELIAEGLDNREIAQALYLSEGTVRNHISAILQKCGLRNRTQIAIAWWR